MDETITTASTKKETRSNLAALASGFSWLSDFFSDAIAKCENLTETNFDLACKMAANGRVDDAIMRFKITLWLAPDHLDSMYNLGCMYLHKGNRAQAMEMFVKVLRKVPDHQPSLYMVASIDPSVLKPEMLPKHLPFEIAIERFEGMANSYDYEQQVQKYQLPSLLHQLLHQSFRRDEILNNLVDLGCGTGLCGIQFREEFTNLIGVDIANGMLDMAYRRVDRRGVMVYNRLIHQSIVQYLSDADANHIDVAICASVFPYLGDVNYVFEGLKRVLRTGGVFACSFDPHPGNVDYGVLAKTGYFGHNLNYILRLAKEHGFKTIRTGSVMAHPGHPVELCIFRKQDKSATLSTDEDDAASDNGIHPAP